jgi:hypothetical protein
VYKVVHLHLTFKSFSRRSYPERLVRLDYSLVITALSELHVYVTNTFDLICKVPSTNIGKLGKYEQNGCEFFFYPLGLLLKIFTKT